jgi:hypothetical protein
MRAIVASVLVETIRSLNLSWPAVTEEDRLAHEAARKQLEAEPD